jgi:hypothetical protein
MEPTVAVGKSMGCLKITETSIDHKYGGYYIGHLALLKHCELVNDPANA